MRKRLSSRLLVVDSLQRTLLFRFVHKYGALADQAYWATPGGGLEEGESFEEAACRELLEETGIERNDVGRHVAERAFRMQLPDGEYVWAEERFFLVSVSSNVLSRAQWTALEREVMADSRWWSLAELASTSETIYPEDLSAILNASGLSGSN
ncbi:NUDIX hydrolase [Paraburkholderia caffeinilytica]|uniref:DNA mismatch repair protein MutT n=1 Tax=Paraburkholderia caffeinilytica TaxID=1761016 RepID=A0ABQ1NBV5_9BURK|nr:NUDIX domain-containing protein [Paraburkholderia caffeinilytica]GGC68899.1 DNA mismatch repair protein MutT [Paraburkholderia caffeinilytica]CAB3784134.1 RNA pyrophosphohydrolase [Paraburkholderia caffeinilytica]